jgi:transcriptional regulator with XRE-family HTH domain
METLGALLRQLRKARGQTLMQTAERAGISYVTLSRWETGTYLPRLPELEAALRALDAVPAQHVQALILIQAPRAARHFRQQEQQRHPDLVEWAGPGPSIGDMLRALRCRQRLTAEQVAATLRVHPSTVRRWEQAQVAVPEERLPDLCRTLGADAQEQAVLSAHRLWLCTPVVLTTPSLEALEWQAGALLERTRRGERTLLDWQFLQLEAQLWRLASRRAGAASLLGKTYAYHTEALLVWGRGKEAAPYAQRSLDLLCQTGAPADPVLFQAVHASAVSAISGPQGFRWERALEQLQRWLDYSPSPFWQSSLLRDLAEYALQGKDLERASDWARQACVLAEQCEEAISLRLARHIRTQILLRVGQAHEALALLPSQEHESPFQALFELYHWTGALLAVGERTAAQARLQRAYELIAAYGLNADEADRLAKRF